MKSPKGKCHLIDVEDTLDCFSGLIARCGKRINRGSPVFFAANEFINREELLKSEEGFNAISKCVNCWANPPQTKDDKRQYIYAILDRSAQEEEEEELAAVEAA